MPLAGDIDGDGKADLIIWRASTGSWYWVSSTTNYANGSYGSKQWGAPGVGDIPLVADFDGDKRADLTVWRASTGYWYWVTSSTNYSTGSFGLKQWGDQSVGDLPLLGDLDGDGKTELVVWRGANGVWFWLTSSSGYDAGSYRAIQWGAPGEGDIPLLK